MTRARLRFLLGLLCLFAAATTCADAPVDGVLDTGWNGTGMAVIPFNQGGQTDVDLGTSTVVAPDGALFVVGFVLDGDDMGRIGVAKRAGPGNPDSPPGAPDLLFGGGGTAVAPAVPLANNWVKAVLTRHGSVDRLLVAATIETQHTGTDIVVCRFHADLGVLQAFEAPSNPVSGCTTAGGPFDEGDQAAFDILLQPDGKFIVVGTHATVALPDEKYVYAVRFHPDGSRDDSFASDPLRNTGFFASHQPTAAALASNGKVVVVGVSTSAFASGLGGLVMRLNPDGTQDEIGANGEVAFGMDGGADRDTVFHDLVLEKDPASGEDAIVAVGYVEPEGLGQRALVARLTGANPVVLDDTFGTSPGYTVVGSKGFAFSSVATHPCAGYIAVGDYPVHDTRDMIAMAFPRTGGLDLAFGTVIDFHETDTLDIARDVTIAGNGIYVAGFTATSPNSYDFAAAKLLMDSIFCNGFER